MTGRKASTGPARPSPSASDSQPHWKSATTTPNEAPAASRFITAAVAGTRRLRKAMSSSTKPRPMMTPMKSGSLLVMMAAKSSKMAVEPPTRTRRLVPCSAAGITSLRRCLIRSLVCTSWGAVVGITCTIATLAPGAVGNGTTAATSGTDGRAAVSWARAAVSADVLVWATSKSGPLKPGPNPWASRS